MLYIKFSGAGWMFPFHFGVAKFIQEYIDIHDKEPDTFIKVGGVSAGAVTGLMLLLDVDFDDIFDKIVKRHHEMRYNPFKIRECLHDILMEYIPDNQARLHSVQNRLLIGLSKIDFPNFVWKSHLVSTYVDKDHCMDILKASCHIPIINGIQPYYVDGNGYYDGDISGMIDPTDFSKLICVDIQSPVSLSSQESSQTIHPGILVPMLWRYFPASPFILNSIMQLGYHQAHHYFSQHLESLKKYLKKDKELPPVNTSQIELLQKIILYSISKGEVCHIRRPVFTLANLMPFRTIFIVIIVKLLKKYVNLRSWATILATIIRRKFERFIRK
jgi:hypothetical protein